MKRSDIQDVRRADLRALAEQHDGLTGLAKRLRYTQPSYLSQMLHGKRPVSEKFARDAERKLSLPSGWLDNERLALGDSPKPAAINAELLARAQDLVDEASRGTEIPRTKRNELIALVYLDLVEHGTIDAARVGLLVRLARSNEKGSKGNDER